MEQIFIDELNGYFNLRQPNGKKPSAIFFVVRIDGKQYKFSTGVKCYPKFWNKCRQECYTGVNISELDQRNNLIANEKINGIRERFSKYKSYLSENFQDTANKVELLKSYIYMGTKPKKDIPDIVQYFSDHVDNKYNMGTARSYHNALKLLDSFIKYRKKMPTVKEMATSDFFNELITYLVNDYLKEDGTKLLVRYTNDSVGKLKTLLKQAVKDKLITETDRQNIVLDKLKNKSAKDNELFLWNDEVVKLYNYHCDDPKDELIKDIFLLECTTGQRISDVTKVDDNITDSYGVQEVTLVTKKTSNKLRFSLVFDIAKKILEKYDYCIPAVSTSKDSANSIMNKRIKEIAKAAGITRKWTQSKHEVGKDKPTEIEKEAWEFVKTHTGRHTFISLLKLRGWDNSRIAKYTGQTVEVVEDYARSVRDSDYSRYEYMRKNQPELIVRTIEEVETNALQPVPQKNKKTNVLDAVFGYDKLMELSDLNKNKVDILGLPLTKVCIQIIISTSNLNKAIGYSKDKDLTQLKEKALELYGIVGILTRMFTNPKIYQIYEYKLFKFGFIEKMSPMDMIEDMFREPTDDEITQDLLDEHLKYISKLNHKTEVKEGNEGE